MEERNLLRHHGDGAADAFPGQRLDIASVDQHPAAIDAIKPLDDGEQRALSGTRGADDADAFAGANAKIDATEDRLARPVSERDAVERDGTAMGNRRRRGGRVRLRLRLRLREVVHHHERADRLGDAAPMMAHLDERHGEVA